jgi:glycosyltransferase involved in cell wall biosynthesis
MKVFCIIPAYNEEKTIVDVINSVKPKVDSIVVVDDGSTDNTYDLAKNQNVTVLRHLINRKQGAALQTGNEYAIKNGADVIVHFDADGQFLAKEIKDIVAPILNTECEIVLGSRFLEKKSNIPLIKKFVIFPIARIINLLFIGIKLSDPQCGFRGMSRQAAQKIIIEQDDMAHCSEIIAKAHRNKFRIKEVPITVIYHDYGQKIGSGLKIIKDFFWGSLIK